ncbi:MULTISPECIES: hypothetical protein [Myxococcus]|uniref:hypothetical protein n=1 Tax=Myxococcus TaxID=32 RepID=UPI001143C3E9|nr:MULTISPECIES: hypothetical protein [Myxococcus]MCK8499484.1 YgdI/YgdR family lipoprotein [Myxococcus fulvus]
MSSRAFVASLVAFSLTGCAGMVVTTTKTGLDGKTVVTSSDPAEQARIDAHARRWPGEAAKNGPKLAPQAAAQE